MGRSHSDAHVPLWASRLGWSNSAGFDSMQHLTASYTSRRARGACIEIVRRALSSATCVLARAGCGGDLWRGMGGMTVHDDEREPKSTGRRHVFDFGCALNAEASTAGSRGQSWKA